MADETKKDAVQEGQFTETEPAAPTAPTALAKREADPLATRTEGMRFLEEMDDVEFDRRLAGLRKRQERIERVHRDVLVLDTDYGKVKGAPRDFLFKAGAEKLCALYGLVPSFHADVQLGDGVERPPLLVVVTCELRHGDERGPVVGSGMGSASSWETKHRWRTAKPACPSCASADALRRNTRNPNEPDWYCWAKIGGCAWTGNIDRATLGRVENPEPWDLHNTLLKMAEKRAHVDATLRTTATSGLFSQDEDAVDSTRDAHGSPPPTDDAPPAGEPETKEQRIDRARKAAQSVTPTSREDEEKQNAKCATYEEGLLACASVEEVEAFNLNFDFTGLSAARRIMLRGMFEKTVKALRGRKS